MPQVVKNVMLADLSAYAPVYSGSLPSGIKKHTTTVLFEADNTLRQYFTLDAGANIGSYKFYIDDPNRTHPVTPTADPSTANKYYIDVPKIHSNDLDKPHTYMVTDGTCEYRFTFSALTYAYKIIDQSTNQAMIDLAKAFFLYSEAANARFPN